MRVRKIFVCATILGMTLGLVGCEKHWSFSVLKKDENKPQFCLSSGPKCSGDGIQLNTIVFQEVDKKGVSGRKIWMIEAHSNNAADYQIKTLTYGVTPSGWVERHPAEKLVANVYYSVNEEFYLMGDEHNDYVILTRDEFFRKHSANPSSPERAQLEAQPSGGATASANGSGATWAAW